MPLPLGFVVFLLLPLCQVSGLKLSVQTDYFEIGGSGVTLECNLEGAAWNINNSPRTWSVPPNTLTVISDGLANAGYTEDLSDAATSGIIRMTTPPLDWSIENQFFQCSYQIDTSSLNATRNILARNSGGNASYDESTKKCVFTINEILPSPTKVVTHVPSGSGELDISNDGRVMETITINNDQGQTYNYRIEVDGSNMKDGDQVKFRVTAGPYTENGTCDIKKITTPVNGTTPDKDHDSNNTLIIAVVCASFGGVVLITIIVLITCEMRKSQKTRNFGEQEMEGRDNNIGKKDKSIS